MVRYRLTIIQDCYSETMEFESEDGMIPGALWDVCETALLHAEDTEIKVKRI